MNSKLLLRGAPWCLAQEPWFLHTDLTLLAKPPPGSLLNLFHLRRKKHQLPEGQAASLQFSCVPLHTTRVLLGNAPHTKEQRATRCPFLSMIERGPEVVMNYGGFSRLPTSLGQVENSLCLAQCSQPFGLSRQAPYSNGAFLNINEE